MQNRSGCHCRSCDAGLPHKLLRDSPEQRAGVDAMVSRALGDAVRVLPVAATPAEARRFGGNTRQPWTPRPARTAA
jgi:hypothetical protein